MTKIKDVTRFLETIAPLSLQEGYDNAGLIVGDPNWEVQGVVVCLDSIESIVDEAIENGANLIVAHHPIVFKGLKSLTGRNYVERTIIKAIQNNVAIYAIHTNLDNVLNGVNAKIAERIGVENLQILSPKPGGLKKLVFYGPSEKMDAVSQALFEVGAGHIGDYSHCSFVGEGTGTFKAQKGTNPHVGEIGEVHQEPEKRVELVFPDHLQSTVVSTLIKSHPYEEVAFDIYRMENRNENIGSGVVGELKSPMPIKEFLQHVKTKMEAGVVRYTQSNKDVVSRVAICGGSGSFLLSAAKRAKADVFLTADFKYHEFFDSENQIVIADIGHYESEQFTKALLAEFLREKFSTFAIRISEINTNPVNYL